VTPADLAPEAPARPTIACPRCGAPVEGEQSWCLECGLAARTRLSRSPNWRAPLVVAGAIGLAAIVALVVAFLVLTGDNAPLPTTAAPAATAPPVDTVPTTTVPAATATTPATTPTAPGVTTTAPATTTAAPASGGQAAPATPTTATTP
jgi:hypothetical protein